MQKLCRLCLKPCEKDPQKVDEIITDIMNILLLKLNLDFTENSALCKDCTDKIYKYFDFKSTCFYTEELIFPFINSNDYIDKKLDLKELYMTKENLKGLMLSMDQKICRLCLDLVMDGSCIALSEVDQYMINKCIPEVTFVSIKNPVICLNCNKSLANYSDFLNKCEATEEKINKFRQCRGLNTKEQISLNSVVKLLGREENTTIDDKVFGKLINIVPETVFVKFEKIHNGEKLLKKERHLEDGRIEYKNFKRRPLVYNYSKEELSTRKLTCTECSYRTNLKKLLKQHKRIHTEIPSLSCDICTYQTMHKAHLLRHIKTHLKEPKKIVLRKCPLCEYSARFACTVRKHMIVHLDITESGIFKCDSCPYRSRFKATLQKHTRKHKPSAEFQCDKCDFQTKYIESLKRHKKRHKDPTELEFFYCAQCDYRNTRKRQLNIHILQAHTDPSEVSNFKCEQCPFATFYKADLLRHELRHKDRSEVTMYMCDACDYETPDRILIRKHERKHLPSTETTTFKCEVCEYRSKRKGDIPKHMLRHKDRSEVELFTCDVCGQAFKRKSNLAKHIRRHRTSDEERKRKRKTFKE